MKIDMNAFMAVVNGTMYEGAETYLIGDDASHVDYHIYMVVQQSSSYAVIITKKMPVSDDSKFELFEVNYEKLASHNITRIKEVSSSSSKYNTIVDNFNNKKYQKLG